MIPCIEQPSGRDLQGGDIMGVVRGLCGCGRWKEEDRKEEGIG